MNQFVRDVDSLIDEQSLDSLIRDFKNFESVLLVTSDNLNRTIVNVSEASQKVRAVINREKIAPIPFKEVDLLA